MPKLREWLIRLWQTLYTRRDDRDLEQELRTHLELAADDARQGASSPDRAARAAKIQAGPLPATMDALRDQHSVPWLRDLGHDLRYASRTLRTSPSFSVVAVLTLGLGIGVNTAIFSLTDAVLFKPLPGIHHAERLVALYSDNRETDNIEYFGFPYPDYLALRELDDVLVDLTAFVRVPFVLTGSLGNAPVVGDLVSGSYFSVFGAVPEEGRLLNEGDDTPGTSPVAVISYRLWQERFGGRLPIVGETLTLDHIPLTVVGVAPRGFRGSLLDWYGDTPIDVFAPYWLLERVFPGPFAYVTDRSWVGPQLIGRLQPGVPVNVARTALVTRVRQLAAAFPDTNADRTLIVLPSDRARFWPGRYGQTVRLVALLNISTLVLLGIACFNLANLLLTRTLARRREIGLRLAIGASRSRLIRQLLVEVMLLTLAGGLAGLGVAWICVQVLAASPTPFGAPLYLGLHLDARALLFTLGLSVAAGLAFGFLPALLASRRSLTSALGAGPPTFGASRVWGRQLLIAGQIAGGFVLLVGAVLFGRSLLLLANTDPGYTTENLVLVSFEIRPYEAGDDVDRQFYHALLDRVAAMPEMVSVSIAGTPPLSQFRPTVELTAQSASASLQPSSVVSRGVGPDYFGTIELPLIRGRGFSRDPSDDQTALIVNEALARRLWPDQDPMGRSVRVEGETSERRVIGVASNAAHRDLWDMAEPYVYLPVLRRTVRSLTLLARVRTTPAAAAARLRDEMTAHSSQLVVLDARTADDDLRAHLSRQRLAATVAVVLAVMAATLVAVGIFGLFSYVVTQSRRDFGIRLALGAEYRQVQRQVVRQALRLAAGGLVVGLVVWQGVHVVIASEIYGIASNDPITMGLVCGALALVTLVAASRPARRAASTDPAVILRPE